MNKHKAISNFISGLSDIDKVSMWNECLVLAASKTNRKVTRTIYPMGEFDRVMAKTNPWEIARAAHFGRFNPTEDWFWIDNAGNLGSSDWLDSAYCPFDIDEMIGWMIRNNTGLGNDRIEEILKGGDKI